MTLKERFLSKVKKTDFCWEWLSFKDKDGYGTIWVNDLQRSARAHRIAYTLFNGDIPNKMLVCHSCDNPCCVNPQHLFLGSSKDNTNDAKKKGRMADMSLNLVKSKLGENNLNVKLTEAKVKEIRNLHKLGLHNVELGKKFGITRQTVRQIVTHQTWRHI